MPTLPTARPAEPDQLQPSPPDDPPPGQPKSRRRPSAGSSPASSAAVNGGPFVADPGRFDPDADDDQAPPLVDVEPELLALWTPARVRRILSLQGTVTHTIVGVGTTDWIWLPGELDAVCEPLAEYANRVPGLQAMAHLSDDAAVIAGFASYALRSYRERLTVLRQRVDAPPVPVTGRTVTEDPPPAAHDWSVQ